MFSKYLCCTVIQHIFTCCTLIILSKFYHAVRLIGAIRLLGTKEYQKKPTAGSKINFKSSGNVVIFSPYLFIKEKIPHFGPLHYCESTAIVLPNEDPHKFCYCNPGEILTNLEHLVYSNGNYYLKLSGV